MSLDKQNFNGANPLICLVSHSKHIESSQFKDFTENEISLVHIEHVSTALHESSVG